MLLLEIKSLLKNIRLLPKQNSPSIIEKLYLHGPPRYRIPKVSREGKAWQIILVILHTLPAFILLLVSFILILSLLLSLVVEISFFDQAFLTPTLWAHLEDRWHQMHLVWVLIIDITVRVLDVDALEVGEYVEALLEWVVLLVDAFVIKVGWKSSLNVIAHVRNQPQFWPVPEELLVLELALTEDMRFNTFL